MSFDVKPLAGGFGREICGLDMAHGIGLRVLGEGVETQAVSREKMVMAIAANQYI